MGAHSVHPMSRDREMRTLNLLLTPSTVTGARLLSTHLGHSAGPVPGRKPPRHETSAMRQERTFISRRKADVQPARCGVRMARCAVRKCPAIIRGKIKPAVIAKRINKAVDPSAMTAPIRS
jgi:hypothetical protein